MGRKKLVCDLNFDEEKTLKEKIVSMFNTPNLINCFNDEHYLPYSEVFEHPNVKMFFKDEELLDTIKCFFDNDLNITKTSQKLFLHRNTLAYRIDKIKKLLGIDINNFSDAILLSNFIYINEVVNS